MLTDVDPCLLLSWDRAEELLGHEILHVVLGHGRPHDDDAECRFTGPTTDEESRRFVIRTTGFEVSGEFFDGIQEDRDDRGTLAASFDDIGDGAFLVVEDEGFGASAELYVLSEPIQIRLYFAVWDETDLAAARQIADEVLSNLDGATVGRPDLVHDSCSILTAETVEAAYGEIRDPVGGSPQIGNYPGSYCYYPNANPPSIQPELLSGVSVSVYGFHGTQETFKLWKDVVTRSQSTTGASATDVNDIGDMAFEWSGEAGFVVGFGHTGARGDGIVLMQNDILASVAVVKKEASSEERLAVAEALAIEVASYLAEQG